MMNTVMLGKHIIYCEYLRPQSWLRKKQRAHWMSRATPDIIGQRSKASLVCDTFSSANSHLEPIAGGELVSTIIFLDDQFPQKWCLCVFFFNQINPHPVATNVLNAHTHTVMSLPQTSCAFDSRIFFLIFFWFSI